MPPIVFFSNDVKNLFTCFCTGLEIIRFLLLQQGISLRRFLKKTERKEGRRSAVKSRTGSMGSYYYSVCVITHKDISILCDATVVVFSVFFWSASFKPLINTYILYLNEFFLKT